MLCEMAEMERKIWNDRSDIKTLKRKIDQHPRNRTRVSRT
jgi:hypothetical protein